jgi:hypothetical protein
MVGAIGGSFCLWYVGAYIAIAKPALHQNAKLSSGGISAVFFFYVWTAFYSPTWNPTPWVLNSEMFDNNVRGLGLAFAAANNWFWNFIVGMSLYPARLFSATDNSSTIHTTDVYHYGIWRLLLLCLTHAPLRHIRLLLDPRDKEHSARGY